MRRSFLFSTVCLALAGPAIVLEPVDPALEAMVREITAGGGTATWRDLDGDGALEVVVWPADEAGQPGDSWLLLAGTPPQAVFSWTSEATEVVATPPQGAVVVADGITWAWDGRRVRPHHDLVVQNLHLITPPKPDERAMLAAVGYTDIVDELTQVLRLNLLDEVPGREIIVALPDEMYRLEDGATPYLSSPTTASSSSKGFPSFTRPSSGTPRAASLLSRKPARA